MIPKPEQFSDFLKLYDIIPGKTHVVIYAQMKGEPIWASRLYWVFQAYQVPNVQLLNGGLPKWEAEGRALESTPVEVG